MLENICAAVYHWTAAAHLEEVMLLLVCRVKTLVRDYRGKHCIALIAKH